MSRLQRNLMIAALALLVVPAAFAETDRVGSATVALWCNDGVGSGHADKVSEATVCQRNPGVPGPNQCPEFVDRVLLEFNTEHKRAHGEIFVSVQHFDADGNLLETFEDSGYLRSRRIDVDVDVNRAILSGEWLQAEIELPKSARKLTGRQCAAGSLTVLE